ncbi:phosphoribosylformylglycinamidine synthase subunit PurL [archaeon SCG-AAA382B04]|nr:phosphoribosylformylglycinamidine synthase subunit PurL [archaeon SCG-AAA382B04]
MPLDQEDQQIIENRIGREINQVEEELFANLWSEHCAYRSSQSELKKFQTTGKNVQIGPGDDAGVIELPNGKKIALAIESHNHPSYVDPYNGAATGVGGIVRDILSMGARPIALLDPLRFGDLEKQKNRYLFDGVVSGISDYGNSIGVPTVGGDVEFNTCYNGNPLVNVFCVGLVENLLTAESKEPGNKLVLLGSSTGRDGLGGADFASSELDDESETEDRHSVQIGDPFTEKLLIECVLEMAKNDLIQSCRDLGAAGFGGASSELCSIGDKGARIELGQLHTREKDMNALELLLAESQERMLLEVKEQDIEKLEEVAKKYDLPCSIVGELIAEKKYEVYFNDRKVIDLPVDLLTEGAPLYDRKAKNPDRSKEPATNSAPISKSLLSLVSNPDLGSKKYIYQQYDHEVQIRTVIRPGEADAALLRLGENGLALSAGSNSYYGYLDPYRGGELAVYNNAMNLATVGSEAIGMVDCLNFASPQDEEIYWEFKNTVSGMSDMARKLNIPVVGGNVSLYNESQEKNTKVNPTPNVGMVGWLPKLEEAPSLQFKENQDIYLLGETKKRLGGSQYYKKIHDHTGGRVPKPTTQDLEIYEKTIKIVRENEVVFSKNITKGGLGVSLARTALNAGYGMKINLNSISRIGEMKKDELLFSENAGRVLLITDEEIDLGDKGERIGRLISKNSLEIKLDKTKNEWSLNELKKKNDVLKRNM